MVLIDCAGEPGISVGPYMTHLSVPKEFRKNPEAALTAEQRAAIPPGAFRIVVREHNREDYEPEGIAL
jgi:hypothetical protein